MNEREKLSAYEKMQAAVEKEFGRILEQMERLKEEGKTKSATYRQLMGRKMTYQSMLSLYELYDLR